MKKVLKKLFNAILFVMAIIVIYSIIGNFTTKNEGLYNIFKFRNYIVLSGSMEPKIQAGDYITVTKVNKDKLKVNDVITFYMGDTIVTHQIKSIDGDIIITKGTANNVEDEPINKDSVIGKYAFKIPKLGYIMSFLSTPSGLILIIGLIVIIVFWQVTDPKKREKEEGLNEKEYKEFLEYKKRQEENEFKKAE